MSGAIPPLPQYAFMAWCSVKAQGQLYLLYIMKELTAFLVAHEGSEGCLGVNNPFPLIFNK
jgi:hypothetical protein